jgi:hypothetical protein
LNSIYRGVVEDINDPLKAGRVRIRIFGVHTANKVRNETDGVPTEHLPWAEPCCPIFGGISKVGMFGLPLAGSHVFVFFENGNILQPRYFATAPGIPTEPSSPEDGFYDPDGVYPLPEFLMSPDWNDGECNVDKVYGNSFVIGDKSGSKIEFDSTPGSEKIIIEHGVTHAKITLDSSGGVKRESGGQTDKNYSGAQENVVGGKSNNIIMGPHQITSEDSSENVIGNKNVMITGISNEVVNGPVNKKSKSVSYNIEGDFSNMTSKDSAYVSNNKVLVKSVTDTVKLEALAKNVEMSALLGGVNSTSLTNSFEALLTSTLKGEVMTTVGGGIITKVDSSALTQISGSIIMIG